MKLTRLCGKYTMIISSFFLVRILIQPQNLFVPLRRLQSYCTIDKKLLLAAHSLQLSEQRIVPSQDPSASTWKQSHLHILYWTEHFPSRREKDCNYGYFFRTTLKKNHENDVTYLLVVQHCDVEVFIILDKIFASIPHLTPSVNASETPIISMAKATLLQSFAT